MLPFLRPRHQVGLIVSKMSPEGQTESNIEGHKDAGLEAAATDLMRAFEAKDSKKIASALRAAFQILDSEPHEEGSHLDEENESE